MNPKPCQSCESSDFSSLVNFLRIPQSGQFTSSAKIFPTYSDIKLELCNICGLVRQDENQKSCNYENINRSTARQLPNYRDSIVKRLKDAQVDQDDLIIEVGSNSGSFLDFLRDSGFRNLVGVEPSRALAAQTARKGHEVIFGYFDLDSVTKINKIYGKAKAIICRHTLEHVPNPFELTLSIAACLDSNCALALIEVPDGFTIPQRLNIYEVWDEHLFYFSKSNLTRLLARSGFRVKETLRLPHLDSWNLLAWCETNRAGYIPGIDEDDLDTVRRWKTVPQRWNLFSEEFRNTVRKLSGPVYAIGASHAQTNLINYARMSSLVNYFIDDDPLKVGLYPPVEEKSNPILSTDQFEKFAQGGVLLKTGFGYEAWTQKICSIAQSKNIKIIDPRQFMN